MVNGIVCLWVDNVGMLDTSHVRHEHSPSVWYLWESILGINHPTYSLSKSWNYGRLGSHFVYAVGDNLSLVIERERERAFPVSYMAVGNQNQYFAQS